MLTYNLYLLLNFLIGYFSKLDRTKFILFSGFFISSIFIGLREGIGADWNNYLKLYLNSNFFTFGENVSSTDALYGLITFIGHSLSLDIYFVNLVCAIIFCYGIFFSFTKVIKRYELYLIAITPYLLVVAGPNFSRQSMAIGFFLIATKLLLKDKNKTALFFSCAALLSHSSAVFSVLICIYIYIKKNKISPRIFVSLTSIVFLLLIILAPRIIDKFFFYTEEVSRNSNGVYFRLLLYSIPYSLFLIKYKSLKSTPYFYFMKASFILYILCFLLTQIDSIIGDRVSVYIIPAQGVIFASLAMNIKLHFDKIIIYLSAIIFSVLQLNIWLYFSVWAEKAWLPYDNLLFGFF
ncbi:EpsG family protein [Cobetia sp. 10Alg 146]|uniref:EpsG family protein n=1 Tax=Cobetia sp. 10Alg 146 TaxID=3040019 RepID=UPI00244C57AD|nr:EpsG family protein [Cobetia sp. 10Alg 146]MDH2292318.1 EpsG family protein [Cobetia sp. 10Alg 146]